MIGRRLAQSGAIQSDTTFHFAPSHCWKVTRPSPSWLAQVLEAPAHLVAREGAVTEPRLRDPHRLDVEDAVQHPEIVVDAADPLPVGEVAAAGLVDLGHDLPEHRIFGARGLGGDG